jgi:hypothetical protein
MPQKSAINKAGDAAPNEYRINPWHRSNLSAQGLEELLALDWWPILALQERVFVSFALGSTRAY